MVLITCINNDVRTRVCSHINTACFVHIGAVWCFYVERICVCVLVFDRNTHRMTPCLPLLFGCGSVRAFSCMRGCSGLVLGREARLRHPVPLPSGAEPASASGALQWTGAPLSPHSLVLPSDRYRMVR